MNIKKQNKAILFTILFFSFLFWGCNFPLISSPSVETGTLFTEAASTLQAMTEIASQITPSPTSPSSDLTETPVVTVEITPNPSETGGVCDKASFHGDVSIPDGTVLPPSTAFTKIWRIRNVGTCTWTTDYAIVFADGYSMGANAAIPLSDDVEPGETVELEIELTAPLAPGVYRGDWKLRNDDGIVFGLGSSGTNAFWVEIEVQSQSTSYKYDFAYNICSADWFSSSGDSVPCPVGSEGTEGFIRYLTEPNLEGHQDDELGILINPGEGNGSWVEGIYPTMTISNGDHFRSLMACEGGSENCHLKFILSYYEGENRLVLGSWIETYEGDYTSVDIDLSSLTGKNIRIALRIENLTSSSSDANGIWFVPTIRD